MTDKMYAAVIQSESSGIKKKDFNTYNFLKLYNNIIFELIDNKKTAEIIYLRLFWFFCILS